MSRDFEYFVKPIMHTNLVFYFMNLVGKQVGYENITMIIIKRILFEALKN